MRVLLVEDFEVLARDLPGVHGDEICRRLAQGRCRTRVLMLRIDHPA
ncbi:hypothetical protein [Nonomuraea harbinensis]